MPERRNRGRRRCSSPPATRASGHGDPPGHGADANSRDSNGQTPLHRVCQSQRMRAAELLKAAELLMAKGADVNARDNQQQTALSLAKEQGYTDLIALLRRQGRRNRRKGPTFPARRSAVVPRDGLGPWCPELAREWHRSRSAAFGRNQNPFSRQDARGAKKTPSRRSHPWRSWRLGARPNPLSFQVLDHLGERICTGRRDFDRW